ncbi:Card1-like endonuclease domain-containing protein [Thermincola ferriacetica]
MVKAMICLIGDQTIPNLMGVKKFRPEKIFLLHTRESRFIPLVQNMTEYFTQLIPGCRIETVEVDASNDDETRGRCRMIIRECGPENTLINVTGGTKLMAFGALQAGHETGTRMIYVDTRQDRFLQIGDTQVSFPGGCSLPTLTTADFLGVGGIKVSRDFTEEAVLLRNRLEPLAHKVFARINEWSITMTYLQEAAKKHYDPVSLRFCAPGIIRLNARKVFECDEGILSDYADAGLIRDLCAEKGSVSFQFCGKTEHDLVMKKGILAECLVFYAVRRFGGNDDVRIGLEYVWGTDPNHGIKNEIDVLVARRGRLYCFECKSGGTEKIQATDLSKLNEQAERIGGVFVNKVFVINGHRKIGGELAKRAVEEGIKILKITDLHKDYVGTLTDIFSE